MCNILQNFLKYNERKENISNNVNLMVIKNIMKTHTKQIFRVTNKICDYCLQRGWKDQNNPAESIM